MRKLIVMCVLLCSAATADELRLDLSTEKNAEESKRPGVYEAVILLNAIPYKAYQVQIRREAHTIPTLDLKKITEDMKSTLAAAGGAAPAARNPCQDVLDAASALEAASTEADVPQLRDKLVSALRNSKCDALSDDVAKLVEQTQRRVSTYLTLKKGDFVTVSVTRETANEKEQWTKKFDTGERGNFLTHFGMTFGPDRDDQFFAKKTGDNEFTITKKANRRTATFAPSVFFTWSPDDLRSANWIGGPTVGVGFDLQRPTAMVGWSWTYNQVWGLALGVSAQPQKRLLGQYSSGDKLQDQLTEDQLVETTYRPNVFLSILWRRGQ